MFDMAFEAGVSALRARDWSAAEAQFAAAAKAEPQAAGPLIGLARVHRMRGETGLARQRLEEALLREPGNPDALNNLAQILRGGQEMTAAAALLQRGLEARPEDPTILANLTGLLLEMGCAEEAVEIAEAFVARAPASAVGHTAMAEAHLSRRAFAKAEAAARAAQVQDPLHSGAKLALAQALNMQGRCIEAAAMARLAFGLRGGDAKARLCLAACLAGAGQVDEALALAQLARSAKDSPDANMVLARAAFLAGRFDLAWPALESRWAFSPTPPPHVEAPPWRGEDVAGKTIMLVAEQGVGDSVMFARYGWEIVARGGRCVLHLQDELAPLFGRLPDGIIFASRYDPKTIDYWAPTMSAPLLLGIDPPMAPPSGYLAPPVHRSPPAALAGPGVKVGLVWAGNPTHPMDHLRSMTLMELAPLFAIPNVRLFSFQRGAPAGQVAAAGLTDQICDLADESPHWGATGAALRGLDLLVSVDTGPAHVAAALGRPVWMLTASCPDWRWGAQGALTPWYPTMRLYRQAQERDWTNPVARIAVDLAAFAKSRA
jgi:tetratricopeptide (TPR) repeat protein